MQWLIDLIKEWVLALGYATEAWVLEQLCTSTIRVHRAALQFINSATWTRINFDTVDWDINSEWTNYKFTAKEAGYFQVNLCAMLSGVANNQLLMVGLYKNGVKIVGPWQAGSGESNASVLLSEIVHLNGTTDYLEAYVYQRAGVGRSLWGDTTYTWMSAHQLSKDSWL